MNSIITNYKKTMFFLTRAILVSCLSLNFLGYPFIFLHAQAIKADSFVPVLLESISFNAPRNWKLATRISRLVVSGWLKIGWSSVFVQTRLTFYPSNFTWQSFVLSCSELMHGCMFVATVLFTADISHLHYLVKGTLQVFQYRCFLPYKLWRLILLTSLFVVLFNLPKVS